MGDTLWNLYILVTMAQVPPLATSMVVVGAISRYLSLSSAFTNINSESWAYMDIIMLKNCDYNQLKFGHFRNKIYCY